MSWLKVVTLIGAGVDERAGRTECTKARMCLDSFKRRTLTQVSEEKLDELRWRRLGEVGDSQTSERRSASEGQLCHPCLCSGVLLTPGGSTQQRGRGVGEGMVEVGTFVRGKWSFGEYSVSWRRNAGAEVRER